MSVAVTRVVGQFAYCRTCGRETETHETPQGHGPYCWKCVLDAADQEEQEGGAR